MLLHLLFRAVPASCRPLTAAVYAVCCALALVATPVTATASEGQCTLPLGVFLKEQDATSIAKGVAWIKALQQEAHTHNSTAARLAAHEIRQRTLLIAASQPPVVREQTVTSPPSAETADAAATPDADTRNAVTVRVEVTAATDVQDKALRQTLQCPDRLRLQEQIFNRLDAAAAEAEALARLSVTHTDDNVVQAQRAGERASLLARRIEALWHLQTLLPRLCRLWEQPDDTAARLRAALELDTENALLWCALGETALQRDLPREALESLETALDKDPACLPARAAQGLAHLRLGQAALAESDLTTALQAMPDHAPWLRVRGAIRMVLGKNDAMCDDFTRACTLGDCDGLAEARKRELCLPVPATTAADTPPANPPSPATPDTVAAAPDSAASAVSTPSALPTMPTVQTDHDGQTEQTPSVAASASGLAEQTAPTTQVAASPLPLMCGRYALNTLPLPGIDREPAGPPLPASLLAKRPHKDAPTANNAAHRLPPPPTERAVKAQRARDARLERKLHGNRSASPAPACMNQLAAPRDNSRPPDTDTQAVKPVADAASPASAAALPREADAATDTAPHVPLHLPRPALRPPAPAMSFAPASSATPQPAPSLVVPEVRP